MQQSASSDYLVLAGFVAGGTLFVLVALGIAALLGRSRPSERKLSTYECGMPPIGPPWVQFKIGYYVYALLFVVFDIETIFLYPWAVSFGRMGLFALVEMLVFLAILTAGLAYAWKEDALTWR